MNRKRSVFVIFGLAMLVLGLTGGAVLANSNGNGDGALGSFVSRVASILGLEQDQVQDAFEQAAREIQDDRLQQKLDRLVESGRLTQEAADAYRDWFQARPAGTFPGRRFGTSGTFEGEFSFGSGGLDEGFRFDHGRFERRFRFGHGLHGGRLFEAPLPAPTPEGTTL